MLKVRSPKPRSPVIKHLALDPDTPIIAPRQQHLELMQPRLAVRGKLELSVGRRVGLEGVCSLAPRGADRGVVW